MAKELKDNLYWIGAGVVQVDGKDYGINDALPVDKMDKAALARFKKAGKVGAKIAPVTDDSEIANLKELVATQAAKIAELDVACEECATLTAQAELDAAEIVELKAQVEALTEPKE